MLTQCKNLELFRCKTHLKLFLSLRVCCVTVLENHSSRPSFVSLQQLSHILCTASITWSLAQCYSLLTAHLWRRFDN